MLKFDLLDTQAEDDVLKYDEDYGVLVLKNGIPQLFVPIPENDIENWSSMIRIDPDNIKEITKTTRVYSGTVGDDLIFTVDKKLF